MDTTMLPSTKPIFADDSGRRAAVVQWLARGVCGTSLVVAGAVAFTLTTHVPLPGLDRILSPHRGAEAGLTIRAEPADGGQGLGAQLGLAQEAALEAGRQPAATRSVRTDPLAPAELVAVSRRASSTPAATGTKTSTDSNTSTGTDPGTNGSEPPSSAGGRGSSNPHAAAKGANSANPRATAGGSNGGTTAPVKNTNGQDTAAQAKAKTRGKAKAPDQAGVEAEAAPPSSSKKK